MKRFYYFFPILFFSLIFLIIMLNDLKKRNKPLLQKNQEFPIIVENSELKNLTQNELVEEKFIPSKIINSVPFTSQAPHAKWDDLHDEACEEASIIMAYYYLENKEKISIQEAEAEIQAMVTFQINYFGSHKDLTTEEIIDLTEKFYNKKLFIKHLENKEEALGYLKENLAQENIFIIPAAGRKLGNPYFRYPGPLYHAVVIKGYDENTREFITNDPGTRRGESFRYSYDIIWDSIHDFPGKKDNILLGKSGWLRQIINFYFF